MAEPPGAAASAAVDRVDVFAVRAPIDPPAGVSIGLSSWHEYALVRIADVDGAVGWGETYLLPGVPQTIAGLAPWLIGEPAGALRRHRRVLAASGTGGYPRSALLLALDDLRARQLGVPVHRLYGGPTRSAVTPYAASQGYVRGEELEHTWLTETAAAAEAGFRAVKLRVGRFPIGREVAALRAVRTGVGEQLSLMVDGNGGYTAPDAIRMGRALEDLGVAWFEEPLPQQGYHGYPELAAALDVAVAGGEIVETVDAAADLLGRRGVDILQPEVVICGGIDAAMRIADLAVLHQVPVVPHTSGGALGIAATVQLLACLDDATAAPACPPPWLELGQGANPWRTDLLAEPLAVRDGQVAVPTGPGLGVQVDEAFVRSRAVLHLAVP